MDRAVADADAAECTSKAHAFQYRDGLVIALLALVPLRSRTLSALGIAHHLAKTGDVWAFDIPAADTKTRRAIEFPVSREMSARIDSYLEQFRSRIPGADKHGGLWPSNKSPTILFRSEITAAFKDFPVERDGFEPSVRTAIPRSHPPLGDSRITENPQ
jgi:hypothetical protein